VIESRCGILCNECNYKEEVNCKGCLNIDKPFWGEQCPLKSCCEEKSFLHCGECDIFPCELLEKFSYDQEQGDDGKRIEQCRKWMKEGESNAN
jgi:hypothetical protein